LSVGCDCLPAPNGLDGFDDVAMVAPELPNGLEVENGNG